MLYQLTRIRLIESDYDAAASLLDDIRREFPEGEYGRRASSAAAEVKAMMERELVPTGIRRKSDQVEEHRVPLPGKAVIMLALVLVGIAFIGYLLISKRRV